MRRVLAGALVAMSLAGIAKAHRLDEYLQATLIGVKRDAVEIELQLTPGVVVLPVVMAAIDRDGDGKISAEEERAYAGRVAREMELQMDSAPVALRLTESSFPTLEQMREGVGMIRLKLRSEHTGHTLRFENRHLPQVSAYLVNCLAKPQDGLTVRRQERDELQRSLRFEYSFRAGAAPEPGTLSLAPGPYWLAAAIGMLLSARLAVLLYRGRSHG